MLTLMSMCVRVYVLPKNPSAPSPDKPLTIFKVFNKSSGIPFFAKRRHLIHKIADCVTVHATGNHCSGQSLHLFRESSTFLRKEGQACTQHFVQELTVVLQGV